PPDLSKAEEARSLLAIVATQRPTWPAIPRLQGELAEILGNQQSAIESYQKAIDLHERDSRVYARLVRLLYQFERYGEAHEIIRKMAAQSRIPPKMQGLASEVFLRANDLD